MGQGRLSNLKSKARQWTDNELSAAVGVYRSMLAAEGEGRPYSKTEVRRRALAGPLSTRSAASFEYRMRNISAVLQSMNLGWIRGYAPAMNVGGGPSDRIRALLEAPILPTATPPIVFFNIGWMKEYAGQDANDPTIGKNFRGLRGIRHGGEAFNFARRNGKVFGYRPGEQHQLNLRRLGAPRSAEELDGVLVIWMAREPESKTTRVVGWYRNATALKEARLPDRSRGNGDIAYTVWAKAGDAVLLPIEHRTFVVPSVRTDPRGFGMSPTWYGGENSEMRDRVWAYVQSIEAARLAAYQPSKPKGRPPRNLNPDLRAQVEKVAVDHALAHFNSPLGGSFALRSVELERRGWDLEHSGDGRRLLVEVKGLSGANAICELTPNEYEKMQDPMHRSDYVIYIVTQCLSETPLAHVFRYRESKGDWISADGRSLSVQPRTGAVLRACSAREVENGGGGRQRPRL